MSRFEPPEIEPSRRDDPDESHEDDVDREGLISLERYDEIIRSRLRTEQELAEKHRAAVVWPERDPWD